MNSWTITGYIEIGCIVIMISMAGGILWHRIKTEKGLGARTTQFLTVSFIFPTILILALEKIMSAEATAALLGVLAGYLLPSIGEYRPQKTTEKKEPKQEPE